MIQREDSDRLRSQLLEALAEDAHNTRRLIERLDALTRESGVGAHAALLMILTRLGFDEEEAREHWERILQHQQEMTGKLGRNPGVRVAVLDYFLHVNRRLTQPTLVDLEMSESTSPEHARDALPGLATDRMFRTSLQHELRRARRYNQRTALVLFDMDDFGDVDRRVGPIVGDRLLREAAILMTNKIRDIDIACRPGEDELALLLPETDRGGALLVAERYRREVERFFARREAAGAPVELTVSAGIACYPDDATSPEELLERAAQALYQAKVYGKNVVQVYHPERRRFVRFELEPGRFEVEVLGPERAATGRARNLSRNGILFSSPEPLQPGESLEIRVIDRKDAAGGGGTLPQAIRGTVVRLEELPEPGGTDRWEIGVVFDRDWAAGADTLVELLERASGRRAGEVLPERP